MELTRSERSMVEIINRRGYLIVACDDPDIKPGYILPRSWVVSTEMPMFAWP